MTWYAWAMVALIAVSSAVVVAGIGKPRKPTTPGAAVGVLVINGLMVWGIVSLAVAA